MMEIINKMIQIIVDVVAGLAFYFSMRNFIPELSENTVVVITLLLTAIVAETVELRLKAK